MGYFVAKFIVEPREPFQASFYAEERPYVHLTATEDGISIGPPDIWEELDVGKNKEIIFRTAFNSTVKEPFEVFNNN